MTQRCLKSRSRAPKSGSFGSNWPKKTLRPRHPRAHCARTRCAVSCETLLLIIVYVSVRTRWAVRSRECVYAYITRISQPPPVARREAERAELERAPPLVCSLPNRLKQHSLAHQKRRWNTFDLPKLKNQKGGNYQNPVFIRKFFYYTIRSGIPASGVQEVLFTNSKSHKNPFFDNSFAYFWDRGGSEKKILENDTGSPIGGPNYAGLSGIRATGVLKVPVTSSKLPKMTSFQSSFAYSRPGWPRTPKRTPDSNSTLQIRYISEKKDQLVQSSFSGTFGPRLGYDPHFTYWPPQTQKLTPDPKKDPGFEFYSKN